ncbi:hypothetical protein D3C75_982690 [compost metagenome]
MFGGRENGVLFVVGVNYQLHAQEQAKQSDDEYCACYVYRVHRSTSCHFDAIPEFFFGNDPVLYTRVKELDGCRIFILNEATEGNLGYGTEHAGNEQGRAHNYCSYAGVGSHYFHFSFFSLYLIGCFIQMINFRRAGRSPQVVVVVSGELSEGAGFVT